QLKCQFDPRHHRMDVRRAPLLRAVVAQDGAQGRWLLLLLLHHLAVDHTALELLVREVQWIATGRGSELPEALPYRNFVAQARLGVSQEEHEKFFRGLLGDVEEPTAPFGLLEVQSDGSSIGESHRLLPGELSRAVREQSRKLGVSAASLMHLAWGLVLARASGRSDAVFGTVLFGRMQGGREAERVLGMFINTLPVRIRLEGRSVLESVRETHGVLAELVRHEHASL